ncbi:MAG: phosphatase PAP2 family protein, partial [Prevotellaceae bacterium]|nr:phosphatase PAP2 family protein [Prevotellaceae bacterium]
MMNVINTWDTSLFLFLNGIHNPYFDTFMFLFSNKWIWVPFYASVIFLAVKAWKKQSLIIILALVLCIVIADQVSSGIIKSLVERPRPSREPSLEGLVHIVNNYRGGRFGFVSSHAANAFGFALLSSSLFRRKVYTIFVFLWAATASYSRIYLGVHYPLDIAGGIIVGFFAAWLCRMLLSIIPWRVPNMPKSRSAFIPVL